MVACTLDTRKEFDEIQKFDENYKFGNLEKLQDAVIELEQQFRNEIKTENKRLGNMAKIPQNTEWIFEENNLDEKLIKYYIETCQKEGEDVCETLIKPAKILLKEKTGVVFATRFYQDIDYGFYLPMFRALQSGYYCLILLGSPIDDKTNKALKNWILKGGQSIIGDSSIWRVGKLKEDGKKYEIGIMSTEDLGNTKLIHENNAFLSNVRLVLIIDASALLHKQIFGIMNLRRILPSKCSFAICNDNAEGLEDIYSHLLHINISVISPTTKPADQTFCLFFDEEDILGKDLVECQQIQVAELLLEKGIKKVYWFGRNTIPIKDIAARYGIFNSADENDSETEQFKKLIFGFREEICPQEEYTYILVEDELCNPSETSYQFASRGKSGAMIVVFSPKFFFLNFIRENLEQFYQNIKKIAQTFPAYYTSQRNVILQLIWVMERQKLNETDICDICRALGQIKLEQEIMPNGHLDKKLLAKQIYRYTGIEHVDKYIYSEHSLKNDGKIYSEFWMEKSPFPIYSRKNPCYYIGIDPYDKHQLPQYCKQQLEQIYLQGQIISLEGNCYEVMDITQEINSTKMFVRKSSQRVRLKTKYRQKRLIKITDFVKVTTENHGIIQINLMKATLDIETQGYWTVSGSYMERYTALRKLQIQDCRRSYREKEFLCINIIKNNMQNDKEKDIAQSCMVLLNELFHTIYAEYDSQLLVCALVSKNKNERNLKVSNFMMEEKWIENCGQSFYIIEDSDEDLGLLDSITHNFDRFLDIINEYFEWKQMAERGTA